MVIPLNRQHAEHRVTAYEDEQHDGRHFDEREPEFGFREEAHGKRVRGEDHHDEQGTPNPYRRAGEPFAQISPAAVNSDPNATVQVSQYRIATVKPVPGPMNLVAYTWNEPVSGMATESSPRLSMTQIHNHRADSVGDDRAQWARLVVMV